MAPSGWHSVLVILWILTCLIIIKWDKLLLNKLPEQDINNCESIFSITSEGKAPKNIENALKQAEHHRSSNVFNPSTDPYIALSQFIPTSLHWNLVPEDPVFPLSYNIPSVSCGKLGNYRGNEIVNCLKETLKAKPSFRIVFFGDSKIRGLYTEFLYETRGLDYVIEDMEEKQNPMNLSRFFIHQMVEEKDLWNSKKAVSRKIEGFSAELIFARIIFSRLVQMDSDGSVLQLQRWALGQDTPPDILIIGYTHWMFLMPVELADIPFSNLMLIDLLYGVHSVVISYLKAIAEHTKVIILAETRHRPHAVSFENFRVSANKPVFSEFSEQIMFNLLYNKISHKKQIYHSLGMLGKLWTFFWSDSRQVHVEELAADASRLTSKEQECQTASMQAKSDNVWNEYKIIHNFSRTTTRVEPKPHLRTCLEKNLKSPNFARNGWDAGISWWDTHLPIHMANVRECDKLFRKEKTEILKITTILVRKARNLQFAEKIQKMDPRYQFNPFVESNFSFKDTRKKVHKIGQYLNSSTISTYLDLTLNCVDDIHASLATLRAEVLSLLNFLCNKFAAKDPSEFCCTR